MSILVLNGLGEKDISYNIISQKIIEGFDDESDLEIINLREKKIAPCQGCFGCWLKTPGICVIDDEGREIAEKYINSDKVIFLTPVTFGGFSSTLKKVVDRLIPNVLPHFRKVNGEIHHKQRYEKRSDLIGIGLLESAKSEDEGIFKEMLNRIAINMDVAYKCFFLCNSLSEKELDKAVQEIFQEVI